MTADIVEREDAFLGVADDDLSPAQSHGAHAALGDVGERKGLLELRIAHGDGVLGYGSAHFNREPSPGALNLSVYCLDRRGTIPERGLSGERWTIRRTVDWPRTPAAHGLDLDLGLEDGDRLADDPDAFDGAVLDIQLHVHPPRAVQLVSLQATE
jgi:hypothetical protein